MPNKFAFTNVSFVSCQAGDGSLIQAPSFTLKVFYFNRLALPGEESCNLRARVGGIYADVVHIQSLEVNYEFRAKLFGTKRLS